MNFRRIQGSKIYLSVLILCTWAGPSVRKSVVTQLAIASRKNLFLLDNHKVQEQLDWLVCFDELTCEYTIWSFHNPEGNQQDLPKIDYLMRNQGDRAMTKLSMIIICQSSRLNWGKRERNKSFSKRTQKCKFILNLLEEWLPYEPSSYLSSSVCPSISGMVLTADRARVKGHSVYVPQGLRHHWA